MLTNEYFKITTKIRNDFNNVLENVTFSISIPSHLRNNVFITSDLSSKARQKLVSHFEVIVGNLAPNKDKSISFHIISLIEGTLELTQTLSYQTDSTVLTDNEQIVPKTSPVREDRNLLQPQRKQSHNITIEHVNGTMVKSKKETLTIPCTAEFLFTGNFFALNKEALKQAYRHEDFLFYVDLEVKTVDIDILDMFLICVSCSEARTQIGKTMKWSRIFSGLQRNGETALKTSLQIWSNVFEGRENSGHSNVARESNNIELVA